MSRTPAVPVSDRTPLRRWVRSLTSAIAVALAFVAGDLIAAFVPGAALRFEKATAALGAALGQLLSPGALASVAIVAALVLALVVVWQAGKEPRLGFLIPAGVLCLGSAGAGLQPVGREIELERRVVSLEEQPALLQREIDRLKPKLAAAQADLARAGDLQKQLDEQKKAAAEAAEGAAKQLAAQDRALTAAAARLDQRIKEYTARLQEADAAREKAVADLNLTLQKERKERDEALAALRKENEELKKKLAEKK